MHSQEMTEMQEWQRAQTARVSSRPHSPGAAPWAQSLICAPGSMAEGRLRGQNWRPRACSRCHNTVGLGKQAEELGACRREGSPAASTPGPTVRRLQGPTPHLCTLASFGGDRILQIQCILPCNHGNSHTTVHLLQLRTVQQKFSLCTFF